MIKVQMKPVLWEKKVDKDGLCPIAISITGGGKRIYHNTGIKVAAKHWKDGLITKGAPNYDVKNAKIKGLITDAEREMLNADLNGAAVTLDDVRNYMNPARSTGSFTKFYRKYIDHIKQTNQKAPATIAMWETQYAQFVDFAGDVPFSRVTSEFLNDFHASFKKRTHKGVQSDYEPATVLKKLKRIRQIVLRAIREGHMTEKQVSGFELISAKPKPKQYLTLTQVERLANMIYSGNYDSRPVRKSVACYFVIACYSGLRISDWYSFTIERLVSGDNLRVTAQKNKEPIYIPLNVFTRLGTMIKYVQDNGVKFTISNQKANDNLKHIGKDIEAAFTVTCHTARHTAATLLGEMGYSAFAISQILGITTRTAEIYRKYTRKGLEREYETVGGL